MLGFQSIQRIGHHLEDCFKILTDHSIKVDRTLENLFLKGFDSLKELVEELQSPYGLQPEGADKIVQAAEPVFSQLQTHLTQQIEGGVGVAIATPKAHPRLNALLPSALKKMLLLFKQGIRHRLGSSWFLFALR